MAQIGLRYPVAAPIVQYQKNGLPIYGTGFYIGRMVKADKTYDKNDASLYADDGRVEYDAGITAVNLSLESKWKQLCCGRNIKKQMFLLEAAQR